MDTLEGRIVAALKTPQPFDQWLAAKNPAEIVGQRCQDGGCPITNFLYATVEGAADEAVMVNRKHTYWAHHPWFRMVQAQHPTWVRAFIEEVDSPSAAVSRLGLSTYEMMTVTAAEALAIVRDLAASS
jgi:hypothetical protein